MRFLFGIASRQLISRLSISVFCLTMNEKFKQADDLHTQRKYMEVIELLSDDAEVSTNYGSLWRVARSAYEHHKQMSDDAAKLRFLLDYERSHVQPLLARHVDMANTHKWAAIYMNCVSKLQGTRTQIERATTVREHMRKACELNSSDPTNHHMLGMWCYTVADISWSMRQVAKLVYGTPPTATFEESLQHFLDAEQAESGFYSMNLLMIGKCYNKLKDKPKAVEYLSRARDFSGETFDDQQAKKEAEELLKKI